MNWRRWRGSDEGDGGGGGGEGASCEVVGLFSRVLPVTSCFMSVCTSDN